MSTTQINIVILISAQAEWNEVKSHFPNSFLSSSPFGEWFTVQHSLNKKMIFFQSGWGKILSASSTQYVIDKWNPKLIINIGTCGGFQGSVDLGTIILVNKTIVYDIIEQMGDQKQAIDYFSTEIDLDWLNSNFPMSVKKFKMLSADRDIVPADVPMLKKKFDGIAADWESGSIALVTNKNNVKCLILRGVTDLVDSNKGEAYNDNLALFKERTKFIMEILVNSLSELISTNKSI